MCETVAKMSELSTVSVTVFMTECFEIFWKQWGLYTIKILQTNVSFA